LYRYTAALSTQFALGSVSSSSVTRRRFTLRSPEVTRREAGGGGGDGGGGGGGGGATLGESGISSGENLMVSSVAAGDEETD
jgi:hypothetical protein